MLSTKRLAISRREVDVSEAEDELRAIERERLAAFVAKDMAKLRALHADDFEMINPGGQAVTKFEYLNGLEAGFIEYRLWQPDSEIAVHVYGDGAVLRYTSQVEMAVQHEAQPRQRFWQTDVYEKRDGVWLAVWSRISS
jgi:hypothetical protein